jgi:hypothetical protein
VGTVPLLQYTATAPHCLQNTSLSLCILRRTSAPSRWVCIFRKTSYTLLTVPPGLRPCSGACFCGLQQKLVPRISTCTRYLPVSVAPHPVTVRNFPTRLALRRSPWGRQIGFTLSEKLQVKGCHRVGEITLSSVGRGGESDQGDVVDVSRGVVLLVDCNLVDQQVLHWGLAVEAFVVAVELAQDVVLSQAHTQPKNSFNLSGWKF